MIGGFRSDLLITRKTDRNFGNVSAGVLFSNVAKTEVRMHRHNQRNVDNLCCNNSYLFLLLFGGEGDLQVKITISF